MNVFVSFLFTIKSDNGKGNYKGHGHTELLQNATDTIVYQYKQKDYASQLRLTWFLYKAKNTVADNNIINGITIP